jgi:hypothetical protein
MVAEFHELSEKRRQSPFMNLFYFYTTNIRKTYYSVPKLLSLLTFFIFDHSSYSKIIIYFTMICFINK